MKSLAYSLLAASIALSSTVVLAQTARPMRPTGVAAYATGSFARHHPVRTYGVIAGGWPAASGTVMESWYRGWADAVRAKGEYARNVAAAQIDAETSRQMAIANRALEVRTHRAIRDEYVAREMAAHPPMTASAQRQVTRLRDPKRLTVAQLSPAGVVAWPASLQVGAFDSSRARLDALFAERARALSSDACLEVAGQIETEAAGLLTQLAAAGDIPVMARVNAKNFINSLRFEARQPRSEPATTQQVAEAKR